MRPLYLTPRMLCAWGLLLAAVNPLAADLVKLKSGAEVRGEVDRSLTQLEKDKDIVRVRTLRGALLTLQADEVQVIVRRRWQHEEYEMRRRTTPENVEALWTLAEWCRECGLKDGREELLKSIVALEPDHLLARRGLGQTLHEGEWRTRDELMLARGYIKHKGKWVLPQELELMRQDEHDGEQERAWYKQVNMWHTWLIDDNGKRQAEALANLRGIRDGHAIPALQRAFSDETRENVRILYVQILSQLSDDRALGPLVVQSIRDVSDQVRTTAVRGISREARPKALSIYVRALKNDLNVVVNRAAAALAILGDDQIVPMLIEALVTRHKYRVTVPDRGMSYGFRTDGGGMASPNSVVVPPDVGVALLTGQLPYGVQVNQVSPPTLEPLRKKTVLIQKDEQNATVLLALQAITHQNFGFDKPSWRAWLRSLKSGGPKLGM